MYDLFSPYPVINLLNIAPEIPPPHALMARAEHLPRVDTDINQAPPSELFFLSQFQAWDLFLIC